MKRPLAFILPITLSITYACGKSDDKNSDGGDGDGDGDGIGDGDGDYVVDPTGGSPGDGDGDTLPPPFASCVLNGMETVGDPDVGLLLSNFDSGDGLLNGNGMTGNWYQYNDETNPADVTLSPSWNDAGGWLPEPGGLTSDGYALHAVGSGFVKWGSGQGATPAWNAAEQVQCLYDASAFDGISFWIKGSIVYEGVPATEVAASEIDQGVLKFGVSEPDVVPVLEGGNCTGEEGQCWDWHKTRITLSECWHRYSFRFDELTQDQWGAIDSELEMDQMLNFNFEVSQGHSYDFWLDEVMFFVGPTPEEEENCDIGAGGAGGQGGAGGGGN